jgi:diguanylate cyclase (GGDEF)-like protein
MDITERKRAEEKIHHLAFFDALTALPNRRRLLDRLRQATSNGVQEHNLGALLMMDLDHFKNLNDTLGHDVGDRLLKQVGRRLMDCVRPDDTVSRVGGDEFVIILERLGKNVAAATRRADDLVKKIQSAVSQLYPLTPGRPDYYITSSIGLTLFGDQDSSIDALLKKADVALYEAKKRGRNTYRFFSPEMQASIDDSTSLVDALRRALHNNEFTLYYQPQVNAVGRVVGAEALLRWTPPNADIISPLTFIAAAEESGLIVPIGDWVIVQGFRQLKRWQQYVETKDLKLSINVSADQFHQADFVAKIFNGIEQFDIDPTLITLELTESVVLQRVDQAIEKMLELKSRGISFSLDDFGTGYSSLSYLKLLPLDQVKIDSSFVRDISFDPDDAAIVRAILAMSDSLGLSVIAEGVETQVQREFLFDHGCLHYQGYLFGRPVPIENFSAHASHASK